MDANRLYLRRKELGLTLEEVGNIVGVSKSTVRKWETGYIENMKRDKIALLAKALNTTPLFVMGIYEEIPTKLPSISESELSLLALYAQLDANDQAEIRGEMKQMLKHEKYCVKMEYQKINKSDVYVLAAHKRKGATDNPEDIKHDLDIMNDENF